MRILGVPVLRRYDLLRRLLWSTRRSSVVPDLVVVVDNGCRLSGRQMPDWVHVISPGRNVGVSGGWNLIVEHARYLGCSEAVISNDDIELHESTLARVYAEDADVVRSPGYALFSVRTSLVDRVGWFDENFLAYYEDNDHTWRCRVAGATIADPQGVPIDHAGSATLQSFSIGKQHEFSNRFRQNQRYYVEKWGGMPDHEVFSKPFDGNPPEGWMDRPLTVGGQCPAQPWFDEESWIVVPNYLKEPEAQGDALYRFLMNP